MLIRLSHRPTCQSVHADFSVIGKMDHLSQHIQLPQLDIFVFGEQALVTEVQAFARHARSEQWRQAAFEHTGVVVVIPATGEVTIIADLLGTFPLYWSITSDQLLISNRLTELIEVQPTTIDAVGLIEFLRFGYSIGSRTLVKDVQRIMPGEVLCYNPASHTVTSHDNSHLWTGIVEHFRPEALVNQGAELLIEHTRQLDGGMLMMSGGWDSRTLLAGALANHSELLLYNHGDAESREAKLVKSMARDHDCELHTQPIEASSFTPKHLVEYFEHFENVIFPHWHRAGVLAQEQQRTSVMAGVLGEVLGGHYGPPMMAQGVRQMSLLFRELALPARGRQCQSPDVEKSAAHGFLVQRPYSLPWYFSEDYWHETMSTIHEEVNNDIRRALDRYQQRGIERADSLVEAFITEQRGCQYITAQLHSAAAYGMNFSAPFARRSFISYACAVPFSAKVHNSLNRKIIERVMPSLLSYPMAATLARAARPIAVQEASRAVRKATEKAGAVLHRLSAGRASAPRLSWVNFADIGTSGVMSDLINSLEHPMFDHQRMQAYVENYPQSSYHPLFDMTLKIKTADMRLYKL